MAGKRVDKSLRDSRLRDGIGMNGEIYEREVRAMAVADGYVMARIPGCSPFVIPLKEFLGMKFWSERRDLAHERAANKGGKGK